MDEAEFDDFYLGSLRRVTAHVYAMVGDWDEAQECAQEAFARAWSHRATLERTRHPEAWVRTTAHRLAVSRWRKTLLRRRAPDRATTPHATGLLATTTSPDGDHVDLVRALHQLPHEQRRALVLHYLADLPVADIAVETGAPIGTVKARLSRGRAALAALLAEDTTPTTHGRKE